jgi:hypothetical protein
MKRSLWVGLWGWALVLGCDAGALLSPQEEAELRVLDAQDVVEQPLVESTGVMREPRMLHAAVLLADGRVLLAGGRNAAGMLSTTEFYNPATGGFVAGPALGQPMSGLVGAPLLDGGALLVGPGNGYAARVTSTAATPVAGLPSMLMYPTATALVDGRVLVVARDSRRMFPNTFRAWSFSAASNTFTELAPPTLQMDGHAAVGLGDGTVLVSSGVETAQFNPTTNTWTARAVSPVHRTGHRLVALPDGRVAAVGCDSAGSPCGQRWDVFRPSTNSWSLLANAPVSRSSANQDGVNVGLFAGVINGMLVVMLGHEHQGYVMESTSTRVDSVDLQYGYAGAQDFITLQSAVGPSATLLPGGNVLLAGGGQTTYPTATNSAEIWVNTAARATVDTMLRVPACWMPTSACDTGRLVDGRGLLGPEANAPNTLGALCPDGRSGRYHSDESVDRVRVSTVDGARFAPGKSVKVDVTVWAWAGYTSDFLDVFYTTNARAAVPVWTRLATLSPSGAGARGLSHTFTLGSVPGTHAVRAVFRYRGTAVACSTGGYDEADDVAFMVTP